MDLANHRAWNVARVGARLCRTTRFRCAGLSEALLEAVVDQQIYGTLDHDSQVSIGHLMTQQILELRQLAMQTFPRCELHLVPTGTQWRGRASPSRRFQCERRSARIAVAIYTGCCVQRVARAYCRRRDRSFEGERRLVRFD